MLVNRLPPLPLLSLSSLGMLLAIALAAWYAVNQPWLGVRVGNHDGNGVKVLSVNAAGPAAAFLQAGDSLTALSAVGQQQSLAHYDPAFNPHAATTFHEYAHYMHRQGELAQLIAQPSITLTRLDAGNVTLTPANERPLSDLPWSFWLLNLFGMLACLIGLSVWIFQPKLWAARLLALSGVSFFLATLQHSIWDARELALPQLVFEGLMRGNHIFLHLLLISLLILMAVYPRKLNHARLIAGSMFAAVLACQINENLQLVDLPLHSFYLMLLLYYLAGISFSVIQWRHSRFNPTDRGALRWVFLTILLAMGGGMLVYFLPIMLNLPALTSLPAMVGIASTLYIGFAFGILRYRLFQIERWWFVAWAWFLGGLFVLLIDAFVVSVFRLQQAYALSLSLILVGWLYFPVRQWFWQRLNSSKDIYMEKHLPGFVEALFTSQEKDLAQHWRGALDTVFQPLALQPCTLVVDAPQLAKSGAWLLVPAFNDETASLRLLYGQKGQRLFSRRDQVMATALLSVATRICNIRDAKREGMEQERKRIMRDLHDDVGGRLLTLIHTAPDGQQEKLARNALAALRDTIYALDENSRYNLEDMFIEFRSTLHERLDASSLTLDWQVSLPEVAIDLPPRHYINLSRVLDEAITNACQYGTSDQLLVHVGVHDNTLHLRIENNIHTLANDDSRLFRGRGLNNIKTRIEELGGELHLFCRIDNTPKRFCLEATLPLPSMARF